MSEPVTIGDATLYCGDCREILPTLDKVDAVVTDPPYGEQTHKGARGGGFKSQTILVDFSSQTAERTRDYLRRLTDLASRWVIATVEWQHMALLAGEPWFVRHGIWVKPNGSCQFSGDRPAMGWEAVAICHKKGKKRWNGGGHHAVWQFNKENGQHPTQKPLPLVEKWVSLFSDKGETILDPFMGSGTTGVACANLGRKFIGIELKQEYFDIACERIEAAYAQGRLFA